MSGQAGIYYYDHRPIDRSLADRLGTGLSRQGPDGGSEHLGNGLLMVHRAFHVEPESYLERQPYVSRNGYWMTWDGRLDNRDDLLLLVKDHLQDDTTDVALAMAAYEKWGDLGFSHLIGDWSVALWDPSRQSVVLASDYMGVRPLYYSSNRDYIAWSSDLEVLISWLDCGNHLDNHYIAAFLTSSTTCDRTAYESVSIVPCAHAVIAANGILTKTPHWHPPVENHIRYRNETDYEEHLLHILRKAVLSRLRTNHAVCCDLSGGLDSSSVTCMASHLIKTGAASPKRLITFSYIDPSMDDERYIAIVGQHCGLEGFRKEVNPWWSLSAPSSLMPVTTAQATDERRQIFELNSVRANLTGKGGDVTMGNVLHDTDQLADDLRRGAWLDLLKNAYAWSRVIRVPIWSILRLATIPMRGAVAQQRLWKEKSRSFDAYGTECKTSLLNKMFVDQYLDVQRSPYSLNYRRAAPSQRFYWYSLWRLQSNHSRIPLNDFERVKWTHPYLDRTLAEFVAGVPRSVLCRPGQPRYLMRRALAGLLPMTVRERRTKALASVSRERSLQDLAPLLRDSPDEFLSVKQGCVNGGRLRQFLQNQQSVSYDRNDFDRVLTLEVWLRNRHVPRTTHADVPLISPAEDGACKGTTTI